MNGILFDGCAVEIDARAARIGGSWQGREADGVTPNSSEKDAVKFIHDRLAAHERPFLLDVGANTGTYSLLGKVLPKMRGYAFEPGPVTYDILTANLRLNGLVERVVALNLALADQRSVSVLKVPRSGVDSGLASLGTPKRFQEWLEYPVETETLDHFALNHDLTGVNVLKIDTEGCEWFVLRGAEEFIRRVRPEIFCEYQEANTCQFGYQPREIQRLLESWGYTGRMLTPHDMFFTPETAQPRVVAGWSGAESSGPEKLRCAIVKQQFDVFGPWNSVQMAHAGPEGVFDHWPYKASLWEMTCLLEADWYVTPFIHDSLHVRQAGLSTPEKWKALQTHAREVIHPADIPWDDYDLVISLDPILRPPHPEKTVFAYLQNEHQVPAYARSLKEPLPGYDLFLDHLLAAPSELTALPQAVSFPYPRCPEAARGLLLRPREEALWIEARTVMQAALGNFRAMWSAPCERFVSDWSAKLGLPVRTAGHLYAESFSFGNPPRWGDPLEHLKAVGHCKYYLGCAAAGAGQGLCDAASLGCICIGSARLAYHRLICHPECLAGDWEDALRRFERVKASPALQAEILAWQDAALRRVMIEAPLRTLRQAVQMKRAALRGRDSRPVAVTVDGRADYAVLKPEALPADPSAINMQSLVRRAGALVASQPERALTLTRQALWFDENFTPASLVQAAALDKLGRSAEATQVVEAAAQRQPGNAQLKALLAQLRQPARPPESPALSDLRLRLGRMTGRAEAVSPEEFNVTVDALHRCLAAPDLDQHLDAVPWQPPALAALVAHEIVLATRARNGGLVTRLEKLYGLLSLNPAWGQPSGLSGGARTDWKRSLTPEDIRNNRELVEFLLQENAGLADHLREGRHFEAGLILKDWVAQQIPICVARRHLIEPGDALSAFHTFQAKRGAVWCGGAAAYFMQVLRLFGLSATTFAYAYESGEHHVSHVTTMLHGRDGRFYLLDAYLNYHYEDPDSGEPLDFGTLLERVRAGRWSGIRQSRWPIHRPYLFNPEERGQGHYGIHALGGAGLTRTPEGTFAPTVCVTQDDLPGWNAVVDRHRRADTREVFLLKTLLTSQRWGTFNDAKVDEKFARLLGRDSTTVDASAATPVPQSVPDRAVKPVSGNSHASGHTTTGPERAGANGSSASDGDQPAPARNGHGNNPEQQSVRQRLAEMLGRRQPLSMDEYAAATNALGRLFKSPQPREHIARFGRFFPAALRPLLAVYIDEAARMGKTPLVEAMREIQSLLNASPLDATPPLPPSRECSAGSSSFENKLGNSSPTDPVVPSGEDAAAARSAVLRRKLAAAIEQTDPLTPEELARAQRTLAAMLKIKNREAYVREHREELHPVLWPLLQRQINSARLANNQPLLRHLEEIGHWLGECGLPRTVRKDDPSDEADNLDGRQAGGMEPAQGKNGSFRFDACSVSPSVTGGPESESRLPAVTLDRKPDANFSRLEDHVEVIIAVRNPCNYHCEYCVGGLIPQRIEKFKFDRIRAVFDQIKDKFIVTALECGSGEPTVHPQFKELLNMLLEYGCVSIPSNNSRHPRLWLPPDGRKLLFRAALHPEGEARLDSYLQHLELIRDSGAKTNIIFVAHPSRIPDVNRYRELFHAKGFEFVPTPFRGEFNGKRYPTSYSDEEKNILGLTSESRYWLHRIDAEIKNRDFSRIPCIAGQRSFYLNANGDVRRCLYDPKVLKRPLQAAAPCAVKKCGCGLLLEKLNTHNAEFWNLWHRMTGLPLLQDARTNEEMFRDNLAIYHQLMGEYGKQTVVQNY